MSKSKLQFPGIDHEFTMKNKIKVISVNSAKKKELEKKTSAAKLKELNEKFEGLLYNNIIGKKDSEKSNQVSVKSPGPQQHKDFLIKSQEKRLNREMYSKSSLSKQTAVKTSKQLFTEDSVNTMWASPVNRNRNKLYSSLEIPINLDLQNITSTIPSRMSLPKIKRKIAVKSQMQDYEKPTPIIQQEKMTPQLTTKKKIRPKFTKIENMFQSQTMLLQDYTPSESFKKDVFKPIPRKKLESERYNFVSNDPQLEIEVSSIHNNEEIKYLQKQVILLKIENKKQKEIISDQKEQIYSLNIQLEKLQKSPRKEKKVKINEKLLLNTLKTTYITNKISQGLRIENFNFENQNEQNFETARVIQAIQKSIQSIYTCQRAMILEQSEKDHKIFLRRGDITKYGEFLTVDLNTKSILSDFVHSDSRTLTIGTQNRNKINLCMELGKQLDLSFGWKDPRNFMIQNIHMVKLQNDHSFMVILLMNHYEGQHYITPEKLLYEIENLMLFEPQQPSFVDFGKDQTPLTHNIFTTQMHNCINFIHNQEVTIVKIRQIRMIQDMIESILKSLSMRAFMEDCQVHLSKIFNCQRVNMIMVDRPRRKLFRIKYGERGKYIAKYVEGKFGKKQPQQERFVIENDYMESFPIEESDDRLVKTGLAGYVAKGYFSMLTDNVDDDNRFVQYIDDPQGCDPNIEPAKQILTAPIFTRNDKDDHTAVFEEEPSHIEIEAETTKFDIRKAKLSNYPRAIIQLINKYDAVGFQQKDIDLLEQVGEMIGRCHDVIIKVEQIFAMRSVLDSMTQVSQTIENNLFANTENYEMLKYSFRNFNDTFDQI